MRHGLSEAFRQVRQYVKLLTFNPFFFFSIFLGILQITFTHLFTYLVFLLLTDCRVIENLMVIYILQSAQLIEILLLGSPVFIMIHGGSFHLHLVLFVQTGKRLFCLLLTAFLFILGRLFIKPAQFITRLYFRIKYLVIDTLNL